jgi:hypothetical protein
LKPYFQTILNIKNIKLIFLSVLLIFKFLKNYFLIYFKEKKHFLKTLHNRTSNTLIRVYLVLWYFLWLWFEKNCFIKVFLVEIGLVFIYV